MKKLFANKQIREWDNVTIAKGVPSIALMERAANRLTDAICSTNTERQSIAICAGVGNNGGDALAVARLLIKRGYESVTTYLFRPNGQGLSPDCNSNFLALDDVITVHDLDSAPTIDELSTYDIIIDGLFGSGLSRPLGGPWSEVVERMNRSNTKIISIDIPSGAYADRLESAGAIVNADLVLTLQIPKRVFMFPESQRFMKDFEVLDIGLDQEYHEKEECDYLLLEESDPSMPQRAKFSHKGTYGHTLLIAGSRGMYGAAILGARACLQSGVGLLTVHSGAEAMPIVQAAVPAAMFSSDKAFDKVVSLPDLARFTAIACGPGLGVDLQTIAFVDELLDSKRPLVLDADALNIISSENWQARISAGSIITPHPKEFDRLFGSSDDNLQAIELQREKAKKHQLVIIRKGAFTSIALPDGRVVFNSSGNPYMATGGMGDILTGFIGGLLGQGLSAEQAALNGVYYHGAAGDAALKVNGGRSLTCQDVIEQLLKA